MVKKAKKAASGVSPDSSVTASTLSDPPALTTVPSSSDTTTSSSASALLPAAPATAEPLPNPGPFTLSNLSELKIACDDCVKQYFTKTTEFTPSHLHTDVRLVLGWSAALIAFGSAYYGYVVPFEESKLLVSVGVTIYTILSAAQWIYAKYVEKEEIFVGKRRTVSSRISTERLTLSSSIPPSPTAPSPFYPFIFSRSPKRTSPTYPSYSLTLSYLHSSNAGKALLHKSSYTLTKGLGELFDKKGGLRREVLEKELEEGWKGVVGA